MKQVFAILCLVFVLLTSNIYAQPGQGPPPPPPVILPSIAITSLDTTTSSPFNIEHINVIADYSIPNGVTCAIRFRLFPGTTYEVVKTSGQWTGPINNGAFSTSFTAGTAYPPAPDLDSFYLVYVVKAELIDVSTGLSLDNHSDSTKSSAAPYQVSWNGTTWVDGDENEPWDLIKINGTFTMQNTVINNPWWVIVRGRSIDSGNNVLTDWTKFEEKEADLGEDEISLPGLIPSFIKGYCDPVTGDLQHPDNNGWYGVKIFIEIDGFNGEAVFLNTLAGHPDIDWDNEYCDE